MIVLTTAIAASSYLLAYVVPELVKNYASIGNELPEITKFIIGVSEFVTSYGLYVLFALSFLLFSLIILIKYSKKAKYYYYEFLSIMPIVGGFIRDTDKYNLFTTVGMLSSQGIRLDIAFGIAKTGIIMPRILINVDNAILDIRSGKKVSDSLLDNELLDKSVSGIVRAGEDSNMISTRIMDVSNILKERRDKVFMTLTTVIGPISILIVGAIILTIALGMLMPMFNLNDMNF
jgi:general secretion pathway protein F